MKILIIGSSGLLGTALTMKCAERHITYIAWTHEVLEVTDRTQLQAMPEADVVINTAAMVGINPCEKHPVEAFAVNTVAPANLARICQERGQALVQISTHTVFDGTSAGGYLEDSAPNPLNIYGATKYAAECLVRNNCEKHYIMRLPTLFGPRRNTRLGFPDKVIQWIREGQELRIADDKIDSPSYSLDVADQILSILVDRRSPGIYHVANLGAVSFYDFVLHIVKTMGARVEVERAKDAEFQTLARNPLRTAIFSTKLRVMRTWHEALEDYLQTWVMRAD